MVRLIFKASKSPVWRPFMREIGRAPSELQSRLHLVCRLLLEKKKKTVKSLPRVKPALPCECPRHTAGPSAPPAPPGHAYPRDVLTPPPLQRRAAVADSHARDR